MLIGIVTGRPKRLSLLLGLRVLVQPATFRFLLGFFTLCDTSNLARLSLSLMAAESGSKEHLSNQEFGRVRDTLKEKLALNPNDISVRNRLGLILLTLNEYEEAVLEFRLSLKLDPGNLEAANNLALALTKTGQLDEAIDLCENLIKRFPFSPDLHSNYALALWQQASEARSAEWGRVIAEFRKALLYRPQDADVLNNLGMAFGQKGDMDSSEEQFRKALRLKPDFFKARTNLAVVLRRKQRYEEALRELRASLRQAPEFVETHYQLGIVFLDMGNLESAVSEWQLAITLDPDYSKAYYSLSSALHRLGRQAEARTAQEKFISLEQARREFVEARVHNTRGLQAAQVGNLDQALEEFGLAVQGSPKSASFRNNLGFVLARKQQFPSAIEQFRQAVLLKNNYAMAYYNLGLALSSMGQEQTAADAFRRAKHLDPRFELPAFVGRNSSDKAAHEQSSP